MIMKNKIRICFVGCGQFCRFFVSIFKNHPVVEFIAVCDKFPERSKEFLKRSVETGYSILLRRLWSPMR